MRKLTFATTLFGLLSCAAPKPAQRQLIGSYLASANDWTAELRLNPDSTFSEKVRFRGGATEQIKGRWEVHDYCLDVDKFLLPPGSVPRDFMESSDAGPRSSKTTNGSYISEWCLTIEPTIFGAAELAIASDIDRGFVKVARPMVR